MANNYISITTTGSRHGSSLLGQVNSLASVRDALKLLKADMDQMTDGSTFTTVETAFGLPTGRGQATYNLLAGAVDELAATNITQLISWLGANR